MRVLPSVAIFTSRGRDSRSEVSRQAIAGYRCMTDVAPALTVRHTRGPQVNGALRRSRVCRPPSSLLDQGVQIALSLRGSLTLTPRSGRSDGPESPGLANAH